MDFLQPQARSIKSDIHDPPGGRAEVDRDDASGAHEPPSHAKAAMDSTFELCEARQLDINS